MSSTDSRTNPQQRLDEFEREGVPQQPYVDALNELAATLIETEPAQAQKHLRRAHLMAAQLRYTAGETRSLTLLSWLHLIDGHPDRALVRALQAEAVARAAHEPKLQASALYMVSLVHDHVGNFVDALAARQHTLALAREIGDQALEGKCLMAMGAQHDHRQHFNEALACYRQAYALFVSLDVACANAALNNIATALVGLGRFDEGLALAKQALAECDRANVRHLTLIMQTIGSAHMALGAHEAALGQYVTALFTHRCAEQDGYIGDKTFEATLLMAMAKAYAATKNRPMTLSSLEQALAISETIGMKPILAEAHDALSNFYCGIHVWSLALAHAEQRETVKATCQLVDVENHKKVMKTMAVVRAASDKLERDLCHPQLDLGATHL
jgi:tetratricopeptide (TPR) repeat protein